MPVIAVIPARYGSTRLPAKAIADIGGVPMVVRVWRQVRMAHSIERVIVATDDERIAAPVRAAGGEAMMTSTAHQSGTDRIAEVAAKVHADIYINVQGDQPFTDPRDLEGVPPGALRHIGIYAYRRDFLMRFASMAQGKLEQLEKLEQLRALENGYRIRVVASVSPSLEIDTAEDLAKARHSQTGKQ